MSVYSSHPKGSNSKTRLDQLLVEQGLAESRSKAQALIMAGRVSVAGQPASKAGAMVPLDAELQVTETSDYFSRGGDKLASVAEDLKLDFTDQMVLDVGSSTGGFTDYVLKHGAKRVIAVDVGTGQLDWRLRNDDQVEVHERTDIRDFQIKTPADVAVVDVSFVSILKVIAAVAAQVKPGGQIIAMIKPQFEADKVLADKYHGVIDDESVRQQILGRVRGELGKQFKILGEADSAVHGPKGNRERFFVLASKSSSLSRTKFDVEDLSS